MKKIDLILFSTALFLLVVGGCKKELIFKPSGTSGFILVNGISNNSAIITNFNIGNQKKAFYAQMKSLPYASAVFFNSYSGIQKLGLYQLPDTNENSKPVLDLTLNLPINTMHTLFVMGTTQDPDHLFTTDELPYHESADSVMAIRFVNLSKGSNPVAVNLVGQAHGSETDNIPYKTITAFKRYAAKSSVSSYTFEFRDKASGALLGTCLVDGVNAKGDGTIPNMRRNRNFTLAFLAVSGGDVFDRVKIVDHNQIY